MAHLPTTSVLFNDSGDFFVLKPKPTGRYTLLMNILYSGDSEEITLLGSSQDWPCPRWSASFSLRVTTGKAADGKVGLQHQGSTDRHEQGTDGSQRWHEGAIYTPIL